MFLQQLCIFQGYEDMLTCMQWADGMRTAANQLTNQLFRKLPSIARVLLRLDSSIYCTYVHICTRNPVGTDHIKRKKHKRTCIGEIVLAEPASRSWVGFQYCPYLAQRERRQDLQEYFGTELALATSMLVHHAADTTDSGGGGIFFSPFQMGLFVLPGLLPLKPLAHIP